MHQETQVASVVIRAIAGVLCIGLIFWGVLPAVAGRFHSGCLALVLAGSGGLALSLWFEPIAAGCRHLWQSVGGRVMLSVAAGLLAALMLLFLAVSAQMVAACFRPVPEKATVIVLGAKIRGEQPSLVLQGRLDAAAEYLKDHPDARCIVSGGQGADEPCPEATVMKRCLVEAGIEPERILCEEKATSTYENIIFSQQLLRQNGLPERVVIVTQEFHQYRAQQFAEDAGFDQVGAVTAHTPWYLLGSYWVRDFAGICYKTLFGG